MSSTNKNDWERTGDKNEDQLYFYLAEEMYDCSLRVGSQEGGFKIFKCHKVILGVASSVFQTMFTSNFKEGTLDKDDPIELNGVSPAAFDIAMRFVYGNQTDFGDALSAVQVYRFAHLMQIKNLVEVVEETLPDVTHPTEVFAVFDLFVMTDNEQGLEWCWEVLNNDPHAAVMSPSWLLVSQETVEKFLESDDLRSVIEEIDLLNALVEWGKAQVLKETPDADPADETKVRIQISSALKMIRFMAIDSMEFAELCKTSNILSTEEKLKICISLILQSPENLPEGFAGANAE